jgi:hypothetical protein
MMGRVLLIDVGNWVGGDLSRTMKGWMDGWRRKKRGTIGKRGRGERHPFKAKRPALAQGHCQVELWVCRRGETE